MSAPPPNELPIRIGTPTEFARVRDFLGHIEFNEAAVCTALNIRDIAASRQLRASDIDWDAAPAPLRSAIALFVLGAAVHKDDFCGICDDATFAAFKALGLVRTARGDSETIVSPVWLYPVDGFFVASDRRDDPDGEIHCAAADAVFPALDAGTLRLLRLLPAARGGDGLDLCGGCGIGALRLSRTLERSVSTDIAARSAFFATFNARLNGADIESLEGDLYAPVTGRQFDIIAAHPPWVPSTGDGMIFRDGGDGGETVIRRIVEGIPAHLRCGGTAVIVSLGRDTTEAPYEQRVRGWLGKAGQDCDVVLGVEKVLAIEEVVGSVRKLHLKDDRRAAGRLAAHLRALGTDKFIYGALCVRRSDERIAEAPLRLRMSSRAAAADFDRVFAWRRWRRNRAFHDWMKSATPRLAPHLEIVDRHTVRNGSLVADQVTLRAEYAFSTALRLDRWVVPMIASFNGGLSVEQAFANARLAKQSPPDFPLRAFIDLVAMMIECGFLEIDIPGQTG